MSSIDTNEKPTNKETQKSKYELLKNTIAEKMLEFQDTAVKNNKPLTAEEALQKAIDFFNKKGDKDIFAVVHEIFGKNAELTYEMIKDFEISPQKTLEEAYTKKFYYQMDATNQFGVVTLRAEKIALPLDKAGIGNNADRHKFLKDKKFPQTLQEMTMGVNYLGTLRELLETYIEKTLKGEPSAEARKKEETFAEAFKKVKISNATILSRFKNKGLYHGTFDEKTLLLAGNKNVTSARHTSETLKLLVDPKNLLRGLLTAQVEEAILPGVESLEEMARADRSMATFLTHSGFMETLLANYQRRDFVNSSHEAKKLYATYHRISGKEHAITTDSVPHNLKQELQKQYRDRIEKKAKNEHNTSMSGLIAFLKNKDRGAVLLDRTTKQLLMKEYFTKHFSRILDLPELKNQLEKVWGIEEGNVANLKGFRESFYDLDTTEHILKIEKDGKTREVTLVAKKDITLNPNATSFEDLFQCTFDIDIQASDPVFVALAADSIVGQRKVPSLSPNDAPLFLQKYVQYTISYQGKEGNSVEKTGYPYLEVVRDEDEEEHGQPLENVQVKLHVLKENPYDASRDESALDDSNAWGPLPIQEVRGKIKASPVDTADVHTIPVSFTPDSPESSKFFTLLQGGIVSKYDTDSSGKKEFTSDAMDTFLHSLATEEGEDNEDERPTAVNEFSTYRFADASQIPSALQALYAKNTDDNVPVRAWVDKGLVFFNKTYFEEQYNKSNTDTSYEDISITQSDEGPIPFHINGKPLLEWLREVSPKEDPKEYEKRRAFLQEMRSLKKHEIAHRVFHFNGVHDTEIQVPYVASADTAENSGETEKKSVLLTQETLCRIAEGAFGRPVTVKNEAISTHATLVVEQDGTHYTVQRLDIENAIQQYIPFFSFQRLKKLDADLLDEYNRNKDVFEDLAAAATAQPAENLDDPARQNAIVLKAEDFTDPEDLKDELNRIKNLPDYDEKDGKTRSSPEIMMDGVRYRFRQKKDAEGNPVGRKGLQRILPKGENTFVFEPFTEKKIIADRERSLKGEPIIQGEKKLSDTPPKQEEGTSTETKLGKEAAENQEKKDEKDKKDAKEEEKEEDPKEVFNREFKELKGDEDAEMEDGTILFIRDTDSDIPGYGSNRIKARIVQTTPEDTMFTIQLLETTEKNFGRFAGKIISQPKSKKLLDGLKALGGGDIIKMKSASSRDSRIEYLQKEKDFLPASRRGGKVTKRLDKRYMIKNEEHIGPITHVGKLAHQFSGEGIQSPIYTVTRGGSSVTVKGKVNDTEYREHTMSYESFIRFLADKNLDPLNEEEVKQYQSTTKPENPQQKPFHRSDMFKSFNTIAGALKKFPEAFKYKWEQDQKMQAAFLYAGIAKTIPGGLDMGLMFWDDVKNDAMAEVDSTVRQVIEEYKGRLSRSEGGGSTVHAAKVTGIIGDEVFEKYSTKLRFRLKAAGYLLYTLENGGPYIRGLAKYSDKGMRVKALLGPEHQAKMLAERQKMIDEYKSKGSTDDILQDRISKFELFYIKTHCGDKTFYGTKFGRAVEGQMDDMYQFSQIGGVKDDLDKKGNIYEAYETIKAGITNNMPKFVMGGLEAVEGMVEDKVQYALFYKAVMMILISGIGHTFTKKYIDQFKNMMRKRGIPIGHFLGDPLHEHKVLTVIDYIGQNGNEHDRLPSLRKAIQKKIPNRNPKKTNAINYSELLGGDKKQGLVAESIESRRTDNGYKVIDALNYKNKRFLNYMVDDTLKQDSEKQQILDQYRNDGIFNSYKDFRQENVGDGDSPFYKEGVFNVAPGTFKSIMFSYERNQGRFRFPQAKDMRSVFSSTIDGFAQILNAAKSQEEKEQVLDFLKERFKTYFVNDLSEAESKAFDEHLSKGENKEALGVLKRQFLKDYDAGVLEIVLKYIKLMGDNFKKMNKTDETPKE